MFIRYPFWQLQTTKVNKDTLITKSDRTEKSEYQENIYFFQGYNCEKLNTLSLAKFLVPILKNPYYTPCNTTHIITPPCNKDQVITPLGDMTCCILNLWHMQNYSYLESNYMIIIDYYMAFFISHVISTRDAHISPRGWYGMWDEKYHIINYLSYTSMHLFS